MRKDIFYSSGSACDVDLISPCTPEYDSELYGGDVWVIYLW